MGLVFAKLCSTNSTYRVGSAGFLTNLLQIDHIEHLTSDVGTDRVFESVRHLIVVPHILCTSLWSLHLASEGVGIVALVEECCAMTRNHLTLSRERSNILADKRTDGSLIVVADDGEGPTRSIGCTLLSHLKDAVVVDILNILEKHWLHTWVVVVVCSLTRVAESDVRIELTILKSNLIRLDEVVERSGILVYLCEIEIVHLQHSLYILRSRRTANGSVHTIHSEVYVGNLTSQNLAKLVACEVTQTAEANHLVESVDIGEVAERIE